MDVYTATEELSSQPDRRGITAISGIQGKIIGLALREFTEDGQTLTWPR